MKRASHTVVPMVMSLCVGAIARANFDVDLLATALFYADDSGRMLLVSGELPMDTKLIIKKDILSRIRNVGRIRIIPAFETAQDIPFRPDMLQRLQDIYPLLYTASIPEILGGHIMKEVMLDAETRAPIEVRRKTQGTTILVRADKSLNVTMNGTSTSAIPTTNATDEYDMSEESFEHETTKSKIKNLDDEKFKPINIFYAIGEPCVTRPGSEPCNARQKSLTNFITDTESRSNHLEELQEQKVFN